MFQLRPGFAPVLRRAVVPTLSALAALLSSGCSTRPDGTTSFIWSDPPRQPYHVAAVPVPRPADIEDDGREAQAPPPRRIREVPDDPTEPYSRNYGSAAPRRTAETSVTGPGSAALRAAAPNTIPADLPPAFRDKLVSALGNE